jgi:hypothetical protein
LSQFLPGKVCFIRPARKKPRVYTERDVGRIVAYARNDGANDVLLIAYILQSFGLRTLQCTVFKILDILNTGFFLAAIITTLKGIITLFKGLKILRTGKKSSLPGIIEFLVPKRYLGSLGTFLVYTGFASAVAGAGVVFFTSLTNNVAVYLLMKGVCDAEPAPLSVPVRGVEIGDFADKLDEVAQLLNEVKSAVEDK